MGATATLMTAEEFDALPEKEGVRLELIDGELWEMASGGLIHETVKANFIHYLVAWYLERQPQARVAPETRFRLSSKDTPQPDVSLVLGGDLDPAKSRKISAVPDLVVEVVSSETAEKLQRKIAVYFRAGVRIVWVAYPELKIVDVYKPGSIRRVEVGMLEDADLPGFSVAVSDFFAGI